ncbi:MAG: hypothetical protein IJ671_06855 [Succinivibrio sp.]|nr:hypothetical protein [Succinivibrio sp.]MBR1613230.1 hypothetical protein [Succinivibrio sp.]
MFGLVRMIFVLVCILVVSCFCLVNFVINQTYVFLVKNLIDSHFSYKKIS